MSWLPTLSGSRAAGQGSCCSAPPPMSPGQTCTRPGSDATMVDGVTGPPVWSAGEVQGCRCRLGDPPGLATSKRTGVARCVSFRELSRGCRLMGTWWREKEGQSWDLEAAPGSEVTSVPSLAGDVPAVCQHFSERK